MTVDTPTLRRLLAIVALLGAVASFALGTPPLALAVVLVAIALLL